MKISVDEVNYIAKLAKLKFSEEECEKLTLEFEKILTHFNSLNNLDLNDVDLNNFDEISATPLRKDINTYYKDKEKLFSNVKSMKENYIQVPKIIE